MLKEFSSDFVGIEMIGLIRFMGEIDEKLGRLSINHLFYLMKKSEFHLKI
jgi:hypothetical protein